jgi:hypothetical protein
MYAQGLRHSFSHRKIVMRAFVHMCQQTRKSGIFVGGSFSNKWGHSMSNNDSRTAANGGTAKEGDIGRFLPPPDEICQCGGCHIASTRNREHRLRKYRINGDTTSHKSRQI